MTDPQSSVDAIMSAARAGQVRSSDALKNLRGSKRYEVMNEDELGTEKLRQHLTQRRVFANWTGAIAVLQIVCADGVFIAYAWAGRHWDVPESAISASLGPTVVQVIAVVLVITKSLFPSDTVDRVGSNVSDD